MINKNPLKESFWKRQDPVNKVLIVITGIIISAIFIINFIPGRK